MWTQLLNVLIQIGKRVFNYKNSCATQCKKEDLDELSQQTVPVTCYKANKTQMAEGDKITYGDFCEAQCPDGKVPFPDMVTSCKADSSWSNPIDCLAVCDAAVLKQGKLYQKDGNGSGDGYVIKDMVETEFLKCYKDGQLQLPVENSENFFEGTVCSWNSGLCGVDDQGFAYFQTEPKVTCHPNGKWASYIEDEEHIDVGPICSSKPCGQADQSTIPNADQPVCTFEDTQSSIVDLKTKVGETHNEKVSCTLESCRGDYAPLDTRRRATCEAGSWQPGPLECTLTGNPCAESDLENPANGAVDCSQAAKVSDDEGKVMGGESCSVSCDAGFTPNSQTSQCRNGQWTNSECGKHSWKM